MYLILAHGNDFNISAQGGRTRELQNNHFLIVKDLGKNLKF